eukprot:scaffold18871_cov69-Phaeocystis_antarctica.AAC.8
MSLFAPLKPVASPRDHTPAAAVHNPFQTQEAEVARGRRWLTLPPCRWDEGLRLHEPRCAACQ